MIAATPDLKVSFPGQSYYSKLFSNIVSKKINPHFVFTNRFIYRRRSDEFVQLLEKFDGDIEKLSKEIYLETNLLEQMLFALVTLPVEFDASKRALAWVQSRGIVTTSENGMAKDALKWAAMTYVVAAIGAVTTLIYYVLQYLGMNNED